MQRRLSQTHCSRESHSRRVGAGDESAETCKVVQPLRLLSVIPQCTTRMLLLSDELVSCCVVSTNWCLDLRHRALTLSGQVSAEWRCPGTMAWHARESAAPLRRSSGVSMPVRIGRLSTGVEHRHPVTIRKVSLTARSMRQLWALQHRTGGWRFVDANYLISWTSMHNHSVSYCSGDWSTSDHSNWSWTNVARLCFLLRTGPANEMLEITSMSVVVQWVSCRALMNALFLQASCLVKHWKRCKTSITILITNERIRNFLIILQWLLKVQIWPHKLWNKQHIFCW